MMAVRWAFALGLMAASVRAAHEVVALDLYRAMSSTGLPFPTENNNLADLTGSMKYVTTEAIVESQLGNWARTGRKYGINTIVKSRYWVLNPQSVLSPTGGKRILTDFGPYMAFDNGVATNLPSQTDIASLGDFVGIQVQQDPRFLLDRPYYWSSVSGFCPNLPWSDKWITNGNGTKAPNSTCLKYAGGNFVMGGLCGMDPTEYTREATAQCGKTGAGSACEAEAHKPTGENGCTYMYGESQTVSLDDIGGITKEDCGGRKCTNWYDFRMNCTNPTYKYRFDPGTRQKVTADRCVEYDLHPVCNLALGCGDPSCKSLSPEEKELGLPFWKGRCDVQANEKRIEALAAAFNIDGAQTDHKLVDREVEGQFTTCLHEKPGACYPAPPGAGGQYCTRAVSGVCTPCKIPGASSEGLEKTWCPYDILSSGDYSDFVRAPKVTCATNKARDLCCLYTGTCEIQDATGKDIPLDDDGFALVASRKSTPAMTEFLNRIVDEHMNSDVTSAGGLEEYAYWQWAPTPTSRNLSTAMAGLSSYVTARSTTTVSTIITASTSTISTTTTTTTTTTEAAGAFPWWMVILGILLLLCCVGALVALLMLKPGGSKKPRKNRKVPKRTQQEPMMNPQGSMNFPGSLHTPASPSAPTAPLFAGPVPMMPAMQAPPSPVYYYKPPSPAVPMQPAMLQAYPTAPYAQPQLGSSYASVPSSSPYSAYPAPNTAVSGQYPRVNYGYTQ